jgi:hypothetical protein
MNTKLDTNLLKETLGDNVCSELLFVHTYSGYDLTSMIFVIRKKSAFRKLVKSDPVMKSCASAFILEHKSQKDIIIRYWKRPDG